MIRVVKGYCAVRIGSGWVGLTRGGYCAKIRRTPAPAIRDARGDARQQDGELTVAITQNKQSLMDGYCPWCGVAVAAHLEAVRAGACPMVRDAVLAEKKAATP